MVYLFIDYLLQIDQIEIRSEKNLISYISACVDEKQVGASRFDLGLAELNVRIQNKIKMRMKLCSRSIVIDLTIN